MNYHGPINVDSWPAPPRACESEWTKLHVRALARRVRRGARRRLRLAELRRAPLLAEAADAQPGVLRRPRRAAVQGRTDRRDGHRPAAEQPGADRRGVLDARQPPRRSAPDRDAARHAERVPHVRLEPVGVARALRGRHAARAGLLHRARAVRLGGSLLPLPQHRRVAASRAGSAPADPHLRQQQGRCDLRRQARLRPRLLVHGAREVRGPRRRLPRDGPGQRLGADRRQHPVPPLHVRRPDRCRCRRGSPGVRGQGPDEHLQPVPRPTRC